MATLILDSVNSYTIFLVSELIFSPPSPLQCVGTITAYLLSMHFGNTVLNFVFVFDLIKDWCRTLLVQLVLGALINRQIENDV